MLTRTLPGVATSDAATVAVSWFDMELNVVFRGEPFQFKTEVVMKPEPLT
jgi:hypothetical protein